VGSADPTDLIAKPFILKVFTSRSLLTKLSDPTTCFRWLHHCWEVKLPFHFVILSTFEYYFASPLRAHTMISEHMEDIIGLVFKYIDLLKEDGIHEWIFDEVIDRHSIYIIIMRSYLTDCENAVTFNMNIVPVDSDV
jgi:hypothetical protein